MRTLPVLPAQIHVPDVTSPRSERLAAAEHAARGALGLGLLVGAPFVVVITMSEHAEATTVVVPCVWLVAIVAALLAYAVTLSCARVDATERAASRALLFAGLALLGPLTLHLLVQAHRWAPSEWLHVWSSHGRSYASWLQASMVLSGPSHIVFALLCALRGARVGVDPQRHRPRLVVIGVVTTLATTWCVAVWGVFGVLPTVYVAVTCVPLLMLMRRLERA